MASLQGWELTQKIIRTGFNRKVKQYFKDIKSDTRLNRGREVLKNSLLIQDNDSALEVLNKQMYFFLGLKDNFNPIATIPEEWAVRVGAHRPQLAIIYRPKLKRPTGTGNYLIHIPQYNGSQKPQLPEFKKGNWRGVLRLKDNSQLTINAVSASEAERVIKILQKYIKSNYLPGRFKIVELKNNPYLEFEVKPLRADYYSKGKKNAEPDWRYYLG